MLSEYFHDKVLPVALVHSTFNEPVEEKEGEQRVNVALDLEYEEYKLKLKQILITHGLICIRLSTVYRWITRLGFPYAPRKKGYYVDGHEKPATIQYQWYFCKQYLGYEQRMHKWIQIPAEEAAFMEEKGEVTRGSGYNDGKIVG